MIFPNKDQGNDQPPRRIYSFHCPPSRGNETGKFRRFPSGAGAATPTRQRTHSADQNKNGERRWLGNGIRLREISSVGGLQRDPGRQWCKLKPECITEVVICGCLVRVVLHEVIEIDRQLLLNVQNVAVVDTCEYTGMHPLDR